MDLIGTVTAFPGRALPPFEESHLFEYVLAGNGLFVRSQREGLDAIIPVVICKVTGLEAVTPHVHMEQRIPQSILVDAIAMAMDTFPNEILFWLNYKGRTWDLFVPEQDASQGSVKPVDPYHPKGANALVDMHSHGPFQAVFSGTDNADETGFRLYICLGRRSTQVAARVGIFGQRWDLPASWVCELPPEITECEATHGC
jgi:PRTRC genetic system protein A